MGSSRGPYVPGQANSIAPAVEAIGRDPPKEENCPAAKTSREEIRGCRPWCPGASEGPPVSFV